MIERTGDDREGLRGNQGRLVDHHHVILRKGKVDVWRLLLVDWDVKSCVDGFNV